MSLQKIDFDPLSRAVVDSAFKVHQYFGSGLLEKIYEESLCRELQNRNLPFERQFSIPVFYEGELLDQVMRLDLVIDKKIVVEVKSVERILQVHEARILTYLKLSKLKLGFLIKFYDPYFKTALKRFALTSSSSCTSR